MAITIGTISYAATAAAFLFLSVLLLTSWRGRLQGMLLAGASLCTVVWAGVIAYSMAFSNASMLAASLLEILRSAVWFAFLLVLLGYSNSAVGVVQTLRRVAAGLGAFCAFVFAIALISSGPSGSPHMVEILCRLLLAVIGMVLVEQLYRNVTPQQRWGVKYLCLGLGGMFAFDFYLYSDAMLFRRINEDIWAARGAVDALVVPLLALATARNPKWSLDISVSRRILFHSTAMLGAAIYLLTMAAAGYYIRYFGGSWGAVLQATFLFGAVLLLLAMFFSGTLRARLKIFLSKNFFSYNYDYREEWLRFTRTLSEGEPGVQLRERSVQAIAELVDSPGGSLWLCQTSGDYQEVIHWNVPSVNRIERPDCSMCKFLDDRKWVINIDEVIANSEYYEGLELPDWLRTMPRAWLVVPLILHERLLGFVVLTRSKGRINFNWEVSDLLKTAGRQAASYLAQLEAAKALLVARQFESFNRMSAFVVHDLKNLISQLSLLLANSDKHRHKAEFQADMIETVSNSVDKMNRLLVQLRGGYSLEPPAIVALGELLRAVIAAKSSFKPTPKLDGEIASMNVIAHRGRLERIIGHLVQNAAEATGPEGKVTIGLERQGQFAVVKVEDNGSGMSDRFIREQLFKPFESTKPAGMGIGTYEAQQYVQELGGRIEVESCVSRGTTFRVLLPEQSDGRIGHSDVLLEVHG